MPVLAHTTLRMREVCKVRVKILLSWWTPCFYLGPYYQDLKPAYQLSSSELEYP